MRNSISVRKLFGLYVCLLSGLPWIKWMLATGVFFLIVGIPIELLWDSPAGFAVGSGIIVILVFFNLVFFPFQILSVISSKQIGMLPEIRKISFVLLILLTIFSIAASVLCSYPKIGINLSSCVAISVLVSSFIICNVLLRQSYPRLHAFTFLLFPVFPHVFDLLKNIHPLLQAAFELGIWLAFYRHWIAWIPTKHLPNTLGMSQSQLVEFNRKRAFQSNSNVDKLFNVNYIEGSSLIGSYLLGRADSIKSKVAHMLFTFAIFSIFIFIYLIVFDVEKFHKFYEFAGQVNLCIAYIAMASMLNKSILQGMHRAWLHFSGTRGAYIGKIENIFFNNLLFICMPVFLLHALINCLILDWQFYVELIWLTLIYALVVSAVNFYISLFIYCRFKGDLRWSGWINNLFVLVSFVPLITGNLMWIDKKAIVIQSSLYFIGVSIVGALLLRHRLKREWRSVDLVRIKS